MLSPKRGPEVVERNCKEPETECIEILVYSGFTSEFAGRRPGQFQKGRKKGGANNNNVDSGI